MYQLLPGYQYAIDYPSDPVNDITIVRSLPVGARGSATGGGLIIAQSIIDDPVWAAVEMLHEKLHIFLIGNRTARVNHDQSQELVVTALQYLIADKVGLSTKKFEEIFYWKGAQGLIFILQTLKEAKLFDWDTEGGKLALYRMSANGNFSELIIPFAQLRGYDASQIIGYFHLTTDEVF